MVTGTIPNQAEILDTPAKRGRKATPPNPDDGPIAAFAHELWVLKHRAGDPSFATMCTRLGAAASKSSLAAATRGTALPTWETTWEFVRVLAVEQLGADAEETRREWLARWSATAATTDPEPAPPPDPAPAGRTDPAPADRPDPAPAADRPRRRSPVFRPTRRQAVVAAGALAAAVAAGIGSLAVTSPESKAAQTNAARSGAVQFDDASFEGDVTFPDGSVVAPGQKFTKVWQLRNNGSVRWEGRYLTRMNTTPCGAPDMVPIPVTDPGRPVRVQVPVTAGESPARCTIYWKMTDATQRLLLPDRNPVFLDVVVRGQS